MKTVHNVRVRVTDKDPEVVEAILQRVDSLARRKDSDVIMRSLAERDGLAWGEAWIENQQPIRHFVTNFFAELGAERRARIAAEPKKYLDTGTHCFFHFEKTAFVAGQLVDATDHDNVTIRLNIACWPTTRENAATALIALANSSSQAP